MNTDLFNFWLVNFLVPELEIGDTVIMDNATFHKSEKTKNIIQDAQCNLIFLPPYSPDLNPIEKFGANFKAKVKKNIDRFKSLADTVDFVFREDHLKFE